MQNSHTIKNAFIALKLQTQIQISGEKWLNISTDNRIILNDDNSFFKGILEKLLNAFRLLINVTLTTVID